MVGEEIKLLRLKGVVYKGLSHSVPPLFDRRDVFNSGFGWVCFVFFGKGGVNTLCGFNTVDSPDAKLS